MKSRPNKSTRAVATFEAAEASAPVVFTTVAVCLSENNYFDQLNFTSDCHNVAVTHRNYNHLKQFLQAPMLVHCEFAILELSAID